MENRLDPANTHDMIEILKGKYRDRIPRKKFTHEDILVMQGQQQVIDYMVGTLAEIQRKQENSEHVRRRYKT